ncbi:hypothetical protein FA13DRAFT_1792510 [Coprinellus micaceus]|uniref:Uncharacterized protein n=1 Tax=Coprinellus micaceus TaxID=71717 RepID=A0A4Y7T7U0_COPMI|nr:hypothetical protein FA13DRAFT_1792510 [Coprinellus micaceus]
MSAEQYAPIEQDRAPPPVDDEPPSYDDLAAQNGPNSRFGRWRGWIEKRAAERYADITPEERRRRRERGWELRDDGESSQVVTQPPPILYTTTSEPSPHSHQHGPENSLHIQTSNLSINDFGGNSPRASLSDIPLPFVSQAIQPTHLKINHFGSRFLPHATSQIRCILPLLSHRLLLVGHDEGLSVMDMFPQDWTGNGDISVKQPNEAQSYLVWRGESVFQMTILELEETSDGTPQGVLLMLVGPEPDSAGGPRDHDFRVLRMHNLSSLTSLARWAGSSNEHPTHYGSLLTSPSGGGPSLSTTPIADRGPSPARHDSAESTWDVVEDLPLRWATDFVPLASPGSRLSSTSVFSYATWSDPNRRSASAQLLAIATKNAILLYESPRGERAYRFLKEFYTPIQPRKMTFFHQHATQEPNRMSSETSRHKHTSSSSSTRPDSSHSSSSISYGTQLCLFVVFDKKAGWIRLADSAVGEFELRDDGGPPSQPSSGRDSLSPSGGSVARTRARLSFDIRESVAKWILPAQCDLPVHDPSTNAYVPRTVAFVTRVPPLHVIYWKNTPRNVSARVCHPARSSLMSPRYPRDQPLFLQVIGFGDAGLEVYETSLGFLYEGNGNGKGKGRSSVVHESVRAEEDLGGDIGFLETGGNWDQANELYSRGLERMDSFSTYTTTTAASSYTSVESEDLLQLLKQEAGMYGWCRKGVEDYRIFWVGGSYDIGRRDDDDGASFYA